MGYSFFPIRSMSTIELLVALMGFVYAVAIFAIKILWGLPIESWAPLMK